jgi:hypothetical protein
MSRRGKKQVSGFVEARLPLLRTVDDAMPLPTRRAVPDVLTWIALGAAGLAQTQPDLPKLRLVPLSIGFSGEIHGKNATPLADTQVGKEAAEVGIDLSAPPHPLIAATVRDDRLFYVFYKTTEEAFGPSAWLLQRIRKVERTWRTADGPPEETVTWQVEAFKTLGGTLKNPDQHFGSFALRDAQRREVLEEYEIGFGEVPGVASGAGWPFDAKMLFHMLQGFAAEAGIWDQVKFTRAVKWRLAVAFDRDGKWSITSPELGLDLPKTMPKRELAKPTIEPASRAIVLIPGQGPKGVAVGKSSLAEVTAALGAPLEDVPSGGGSNVCYRGGVTCNFDRTGVLNTVFTRGSFGGKAGKGIAHGQTRKEVEKVAGPPTAGGDEDASWSYPGLRITFDADGAVARLIVVRD